MSRLDNDQHHHQQHHRLTENPPDRIAEWFADKTIFVTGATGFLGKVLLEKLMRCCGGFRRVYLLVRTKNDETPEERLRKLLESSVFEVVLSKKNDFALIRKKLKVIEGDLSKNYLDIDWNSPLHREILNEIDVVYHCGASLRFDETLRMSTKVNVRATEHLVRISKEMSNLKVFCHVSSAYCLFNERTIHEKLYAPPVNPQKLLTIIESEEKTFSAITHKFLDTYPNTYCFTKAVAESVVSDEFDNFPGIIVRPSIVIPSWSEPLPGWTDTVNGPLGFQISGGKGMLRTLYGNLDMYPDMVPVDIAVNALLCSVYFYSTFRSQRVFNITTSSVHKVTLKEMVKMGYEVITGPVPLNWVVWYPGGILWNYKFLHDFVFFVQHLLPGYFFDGCLKMFGFEPFIVNIYRKIYKGLHIMYGYNERQWDFENESSMKARQLMNSTEAEKYDLKGDFDYFSYYTNCVLCVRKYILKESEDSLPLARIHMKIMYWIDKMTILLVVGTFIYYIFF